MIRIKYFIALIALCICCGITHSQTSADSIEKRIDEILKSMTLEEKIGQTALRGLSSRFRGEIPQGLAKAVREGRIGALLNIMDEDVVKELQRIATEESPSKIPLLYGRDVIHGFKTVVPIPLGLAATWEPELVEQTARSAAIEATTYGVRWTFAPMVDVSRDARWGRIAESLGEDPYLASQLAAAMVRGFQGDDLSDPTSLAACVKHYAGYGAAEGGRDYNTANIPEHILRDIILPPFHAAVDAGVATVMTSFNELNGIPATGNHFLLKEVLKGEWGFDGFIVSDWESVKEMIPHGYAADHKHAAERAATAGMDMEMVSTAYEEHLAELIEEGKVQQEELDDFVRRILRIKMRLGLFDQPGFDSSRRSIIQNPEFLAEAQTAAAKSMVLLKNEKNILPLNKSKTIAVIGPLADAPHEQLGTWVYDSEKETSQTPAPALRKFLGDSKVIFEPTLDYSRSKDKSRFAQAIAAAEKSDLVLFIGGEEAILSGEAHSRADIRLPGAQEELIHALSETGKPLVLVIMAGRPISLYNIIDKIDAIIMAWHPGTMAGPALVDVLYGKVSPGGRLPVTWPKTVGQIPVFYNHTNTGRPFNADRYIPEDKIEVGTWQSALHNTSYYLDLGHLPQFPFGYGLSYSSFKYSNLKLKKSKINMGDTLQVSVQLTNTGKVEAAEVVQLYVQDIVGEVTRPVRELKGYKKVTLQPGQSSRIKFELNAEDLAYHDANGKRISEPGDYNVWIAPNAEEGLQASFTVK